MVTDGKETTEGFQAQHGVRLCGNLFPTSSWKGWFPCTQTQPRTPRHRRTAKAGEEGGERDEPNPPADGEGEAADVGEDIIEAMVDTPPVLEVDIELGELQLDIIDVVQEEHEDAHVVVPAGTKRSREMHGAMGSG